jgi:uncharacterized membrane protein
MTKRRGSHPPPQPAPAVQQRPSPTPTTVGTQPTSAIVSAHFEHKQTFSGPIPHPDVLARYDQVCPGAADRIIGMAERQETHRQSLEVRVIWSNTRVQLLGPILGFILALAIIALGGWLLATGRPLEGLSALVLAAAGIVVPFVVGKRQQAAELKRKSENLLQRSGQNLAAKPH